MSRLPKDIPDVISRELKKCSHLDIRLESRTHHRYLFVEGELVGKLPISGYTEASVRPSLNIRAAIRRIAAAHPAPPCERRTKAPYVKKEKPLPKIERVEWRNADTSKRGLAAIAFLHMIQKIENPKWKILEFKNPKYTELKFPWIVLNKFTGVKKRMTEDEVRKLLI
jgi:hypothetical protein